MSRIDEYLAGFHRVRRARKSLDHDEIHGTQGLKTKKLLRTGRQQLNLGRNHDRDNRGPSLNE